MMKPIPINANSQPETIGAWNTRVLGGMRNAYNSMPEGKAVGPFHGQTPRDRVQSPSQVTDFNAGGAREMNDGMPGPSYPVGKNPAHAAIVGALMGQEGNNILQIFQDPNPQSIPSMMSGPPSLGPKSPQRIVRDPQYPYMRKPGPME